MKVLWITNWYPSAEAPHRSPFIRAQWLAARGAGVDADLLHVDVLTGPWWPQVAWRRGPLGEYVLRVAWRGWKLLYHLPWLVAAYVARNFPGPKPQIVHGQVLLPAGITAASLANRWRLPLVHTEHWNIAPAKLRSPFWGFWGRRALRSARAILPVSDHLSSQLAELLPQVPLITVPNVMDWTRFAYRPTATQPEASEFSVLSVAHLIPVNRFIKKTEWTLDALAELTRRHPEVRWKYVHVGGGPRETELAAYAARLGVDAQWLGNGAPGAWADLVVDVLAHPTVDETFGMVVYEALHRGIPVVATDIPAFRPWLAPPMGLRVPQGSGPLADALEAMWRSPLRVPADALPYKKFEAAQVGSRLKEVYEQVRATS
jgi:glycosyltransferase involved in cell wall biosynthesis